MSKMSELAMTLDDQAMELGFESYEEALAKGYEVDYENMQLVNPYVLDMDKEHEEAHEAWLKEKQRVIDSLNGLLSGYVALANTGERDAVEKRDIIEAAINFIDKGEV